MSHRVLVTTLAVTAAVWWIGSTAHAQQKPGEAIALPKSGAVPEPQKAAKSRPETAERSAVADDQSKVKIPEAKSNPR